MDKMENKHWEKEAAGVAVRMMAEEVLAEDVSDVVISEALQARVGKLFAEERARKSQRRKTIGRRVAVVLIAAVLVALTACMSISEIREKIIEFVITYQEKFFSYKSETASGKEDLSGESVGASVLGLEGSFVRREPAYLPEGFEMLRDESNQHSVSIYYGNPADGSMITYEQSPIGTLEYYGDSEGVDLTTISVNGYSGVVAIKEIDNNQRIAIFWNDGVFDYSINTTISIEETQKIAESVRDAK